MRRRTGPSSGPVLPGEDPFGIDVTVAHAARLQNYLAGGDDNFAADREVADHLGAVLPGGIDSARAGVRAMADFMERAVWYLAEAGVRQFLNIGASVPTANEVHDVAQQAAPESRVVYVGSDPIVLAHAHELLTGTSQGATAYIHGSVRDPQNILRQAAATLDLTRPVAVMLLATLSFVPDERDPCDIVAQLLEGVPSGSYLVITHRTDDMSAEAAKWLSETLRERYVVRSHAEVSRFFDGLDMVEPGLVQIDRWHHHQDPPHPDTERFVPICAALARKP